MTTPEGESLYLQGPNWLVALGRGLEHRGALARMDRLVCSRASPDQFCVIDVASGRYYTLRALEPSVALPTSAALILAA